MQKKQEHVRRNTPSPAAPSNAMQFWKGRSELNARRTVSPWSQTRRSDMTDDLNAGFTGTPTEQPTGVRKAARTATDVVRRETSAVATGAREHPQTATTLVLGVGALAFA